MPEPAITRRAYLQDTRLHRQYYAQFVTLGIKSLVRGLVGSEAELRAAFQQDQGFNTIPLRVWDDAGMMLPRQGVERALREAGDVWSISGVICILKEAAREIVEEQSR